MKRTLMALGIAGIAAVSAVGAASAADYDSAGQPPKNASSVGVERATRNSDGGDREHGKFGQEQSAFVADINAGGTEWANYGEFLQDWKAD
jgi:hypothetical protein